MKTPILHSTLAAVTLSFASLEAAEEKTIGEKTGEVIDKTVEKSKELGRVAVEKTKEAGRAVADGTKKATNAAKDAIAPDTESRQVSVTLSEHKIDLPTHVPPGKTAFVVRNAGKREHSFEIEGEGLEKKLMLGVNAEETKTLHVDLKPGTYKVRCPMKGHEAKGMEAILTVN